MRTGLWGRCVGTREARARGGWSSWSRLRAFAKGGIGAFASKSILEGTVILAEEPLMLANIMEVYHSYDNLSIEKRKMFRSLYGWPGVNPEPTMAIFQTNR